jgi:uncharacterized repeat protein (TIGR01451 family)
MDYEHIDKGGYCQQEPDTFSISGTKFNDEDKDGVKDGTEVGLQGWEIILSESNTFTASTTTESNGAYSFTGLTAGTYTLCETQQTGWNQTFPTTNGGCHEVAVATADITDIDFGNAQQEPPCTSNCGGNPCTSNCGGGGGGGGNPVLLIQKSVSKLNVVPGEVVEYTIVVKNITSPIAYNVVLNDVLPSGLVHEATNNTLQTWNLGNLGLNEEATTIYNVLIGQSVTEGDYINVATVQADNHPSISDDAVVRVGPFVTTFTELPETGISFTQVVVWVNIMFLALFMAIQIASFIEVM